MHGEVLALLHWSLAGWTEPV